MAELLGPVIPNRSGTANCPKKANYQDKVVGEGYGEDPVNVATLRKGTKRPTDAHSSPESTFKLLA